jgi:hypothetical protein
MAYCIAGCQYIPSIEYFAHWLQAGSLRIEACAYYQKRSWRNKTCILGQIEPLELSIPLRKGKNNSMPITQVAIAYDEPWYRQHYHSLCTAYGKTAFFEEMQEEIKETLYSKPETLWDLNIKMLNIIIGLLPGRWMYDTTDLYQEHDPQALTDVRKGVPAGISSISALPYPQVNRALSSHQSNLSIIDALCHLGPGTKDYLELYRTSLYPSAT